ncbi:SDR family oxidoreductase [Nocardia sp. NPDC046763]|uniref:SDR family NAD(P)-dependent oxidoreductase n=1 Tax=Nocardia sp. NPDC046763 TaxID=3155256 RepID=UPI0033E37DC3
MDRDETRTHNSVERPDGRRIKMGVLQDKSAIVTGAGQGVGQGIALALAAEGAKVAVVDLNQDTAKDTVTQIENRGGTATAIVCDIRDSAQVDAAVLHTVDTFGGVDILVNNAMATKFGVPIEELTDEDIELSYRTGPMATAYFMRAAFPFLQGGGRVINIRSGSEVEGIVGFGAYVPAKAAVGGLTRTAAREWGRKGVNVNAVCPFVLSPAAKQYYATHPEELDWAMNQLSIPRDGDAEHDVGRAVVFLAGPDAGFVTGCTIMADGGGSFIG